MKHFFNNKTDFDIFVSIHTGYNSFRGKAVSCLSEPEKYLCVLVYEIKVDDNGPGYIDGEYVYLDDFEE